MKNYWLNDTEQENRVRLRLFVRKMLEIISEGRDELSNDTIDWCVDDALRTFSNYAIGRFCHKITEEPITSLPINGAFVVDKYFTQGINGKYVTLYLTNKHLANSLYWVAEGAVANAVQILGRMQDEQVSKALDLVSQGKRDRQNWVSLMRRIFSK